MSLALAVATVLAAGSVTAEPTGPGAGGLFAAQVAVRLEEIPTQLAQLEERAAPDKELTELAEGLEATSRQLATRLVEVSEATGESAVEVRIAERDVERTLQQIDAWSTTLATRIQLVQRGLGEIRGKRIELVRALHRLKGEQAPRDIVRRVTATLRLVRATRERIEAHVGQLLDLQRRATREHTAANELRERFDIAERLAGTVSHRDGPTLWTAWARGGRARDALATVRATLARDRTAIVEFVADQPTFLPLVTFLVLAVWTTALAFKRFALRCERGHPELASATRVLAHPASIGILVLPLVFLTPAYGSAPITLRVAMVSLAVVPLLRVVAPLLPVEEAGAAHVLAALLVVNLVAAVFRRVPPLHRSFFVLQCAIAIAFLLRGRGRDRSAVLQLARDATTLTLLAAIATEVSGFVQLSHYLGDGVLRSLLFGVFCFTLLAVMDAFVAIGVHTGVSAAVRGHADEIRRQAHRLSTLIVVLVWFRGVIEVFAVREPVVHMLGEVLGSKLAVGAMAISLGDIVAFGVTVWLALQLSRVVRAVLERDVFPRMALRRGVPYAVTTVSSYAVLLVGFLFALAAAGVSLDRIAVLAGAVGVGAGFGLQGIVNNFVSGLVLLFERPIQLGDMVQLGDVVGEVRRIGLRSSVVRTFDGAEVILPNSALVGEQVTNWTLSDARRRVAVRVGVAYGTDPEVVLSLLINVAAQQPGALTEPAPEALFLGFGESALDFELRAWVARADVVASFGSTLGIGVERALREAGITIPFPQRDLNVRTTAASAATAPVLFARDRRG